MEDPITVRCRASKIGLRELADYLCVIKYLYMYFAHAPPFWTKPVDMSSSSASSWYKLDEYRRMRVTRSLPAILPIKPLCGKLKVTWGET